MGCGGIHGTCLHAYCLPADLNRLRHHHTNAAHISLERLRSLDQLSRVGISWMDDSRALQVLLGCRHGLHLDLKEAHIGAFAGVDVGGNYVRVGALCLDKGDWDDSVLQSLAASDAVHVDKLCILGQAPEMMVRLSPLLCKVTAVFLQECEGGGPSPSLLSILESHASVEVSLQFIGAGHSMHDWCRDEGLIRALGSTTSLQRFGLYATSMCEGVVQQYVEMAEKVGLTRHEAGMPDLIMLVHSSQLHAVKRITRGLKFEQGL